jgi:hypothetical protein
MGMKYGRLGGSEITYRIQKTFFFERVSSIPRKAANGAAEW